jgi:protein-tyrosine-phosphatase
MMERKIGLPQSVLFACTQNAVRSPMAEGYLKHLHGRRIYVDSVGIREIEVDLFAVEVMREVGIDIARHHAKTFDALQDTSFEVVLTLSPEAHHRAIELTRVMACEVAYWPTFDPTIVEGSREVRLAAYREVRDHLIRRIHERFPPSRGPALA